MTEYWKSKLTDDLKRQYDIMLKAIKQQAQSADLSMTPNRVDEVQKIFSYIGSDHPELYYLSPKVSYLMSKRSVTINLSYLYDINQNHDIEQSFDNLQFELKKECNKSEIDKVYAAIFLLMKDSKYEIDIHYNQNAASAIHYHVAQCSGFAAAFKYAMDFFGIWSIVVRGSISNNGSNGLHAWNIVKLNDLFYHVDITPFAKLNLQDVSQLTQYNLFKSDFQNRREGYIWDDSETPTCSEMTASVSTKTNAPAGGVSPIGKGNVANNYNNLPVFTRLFDVQSQIGKCIENRIVYYEFLLEIPMCPNDKLLRMVSNCAAEQSKLLGVSLGYEAGCTNNKFYIKFNFKN